jgi:hypothetical protein
LFITTLFLGPFDDVITKFYCTYNIEILHLFLLGEEHAYINTKDRDNKGK